MGAGVRLAGKRNPERSASRERGYELGTSVNRAVVDGDELHRRLRLGGDRFERTREVARMVVNGHHDRNVLARAGHALRVSEPLDLERTRRSELGRLSLYGREGRPRRPRLPYDRTSVVQR